MLPKKKKKCVIITHIMAEAFGAALNALSCAMRLLGQMIALRATAVYCEHHIQSNS